MLTKKERRNKTYSYGFTLHFTKVNENEKRLFRKREKESKKSNNAIFFIENKFALLQLQCQDEKMQMFVGR